MNKLFPSALLILISSCAYHTPKTFKYEVWIGTITVAVGYETNEVRLVDKTTIMFYTPDSTKITVDKSKIYMIETRP